MDWIEVQIITTSEAVEAVSVILERYGLTGIVIEDKSDLALSWEERYGEIYQLDPLNYPQNGVRVKTYISIESWQENILKDIQFEVRKLSEMGLNPGPVFVGYKIINQDDWAHEWKKYFHPFKVTNKLTIKPTWEDYIPNDHEIIIEIDPGMAFGSGTHETTSLCLRKLEKYITKNTNVLDVGCGSGILSITAAKLGAPSVLALDLDPVAVKVARSNIKQNNVEDRVNVIENDLLNGINQKFDIIIANILAEIISKMIKDTTRVLNPDGVFIMSGISKGKIHLVTSELNTHGFKITEKNTEGDWVLLVAKKV